MVNSVFRTLWRALIFLLGSLSLWVTVFLFFPIVDGRLPVYLTLLIAYCLAAYLIIPNLVRLLRLVIKPNHIPLYASTGDGWSSDPVNIALICKSKSQLVRTMKYAGWYTADKTTLRTTIRFIIGFCFGLPYPNAPFSNLYLFGRKQDIGFQIPTDANLSPRHRHHVRFWLLTTEETNEAHASFWQNLMTLFLRRKKQIWIGSATHDIGTFAFRIQNLQVTHKIDSDTNIERDFLIETLRRSKSIRTMSTIKAGEAFHFRGQTLGVKILADGMLKVIEIKKTLKLIE
ncbi:MAG: LssY C-terminal domain-containing protein [Candidatus Saccharibacteria bacterium]